MSGCRTVLAVCAGSPAGLLFSRPGPGLFLSVFLVLFLFSVLWPRASRSSSLREGRRVKSLFFSGWLTRAPTQRPALSGSPLRQPCSFPSTSRWFIVVYWATFVFACVALVAVSCVLLPSGRTMGIAMHFGCIVPQTVSVRDWSRSASRYLPFGLEKLSRCLLR